MNSTQKQTSQGCPGVAEYRHEGSTVAEHAGGCCRVYTVAFAATNLTPAFILRVAALYIERHGQHQGAYYPKRHHGAFPPACAAGAIRIAATGRLIRFWDDLITEETSTVGNTDKVLAAYLDGTDSADIGINALTIISTWNDEDWRTAEDVTDGLRAAADDWDRIHGGAQ